MPAKDFARLYISGNSPNLASVLKPLLQQPNLRVYLKQPQSYDYQVYILDTHTDENLGTKDVLNQLSTNSQPNLKTAILIVDNTYTENRNLEYFKSITLPLLSSPSNNRLVLTSDIFHSGGLPLISHFETEIIQAIKSKKISVSSNGNHSLYLTDVEDLSKGIIRALFSNNTSGETFTIIGEQLLDLEFAYQLKKAIEKNNLELEIDLNKSFKRHQPDMSSISAATQAKLNWLPQKSISDSLSQMVNVYADKTQTDPVLESGKHLQPLTLKVHSQSINLPKITNLLKKIKRPTPPPDFEIDLHRTEERGLKKIILIIIGVIILSVAVPVLITITGLFLTTRQTYFSFQSLRQGDTKQAGLKLKSAQTLKDITSFSFNIILKPGNLLVPATISSTNNYLLILDHTQSIIDSAIKTYDLSNHLYLSLIGQEQLGSDQTIQAIKINIISLNDNLSEIQLLTKGIQLPQNIQKYLGDSDLNFQINTLKDQINSSLPLLDIIGQLLTNKKPQHYLILVQDSNELRASGGFINTLVDFTFNNNQITNIQAEPSLSLDRLVQGNIVPPSPVKQLLNQASWAFRDSNVDADFSEVGKQVAWFYQRFKGVSTDGAIALNLSFLKSLLEQISPIKLTSGQSIDFNNLYSLAANPTTEGSTDVITSLSRDLVSKLLASKLGFLSLARAGLKAISQNEINLYFSDPNIQSLATKSGLAGTIVQTSCHPQLSRDGCLSDTIYLNEANFSVAKTNYYLKRSQNHLVQIDNAGLVNVTMTYNYSFPVAVPIGNSSIYKAYYQLYIPSGYSNFSITLDDQKLDQGGFVITPKGDFNKIEYSAGLTLNRNHELKISLTSPGRLNMKSPLTSYSVSFLKQQGTGDNEFKYTITYPSILTPKVLTMPMKQTSGRELIFQTNTPSNLTFGVQFKNTSL